MNDRITLDDIMTLISNEGKIIRTNGRTFQCECPSCHDRRGKFYVTLGEGYYCQRASCEFHGRDPIKLFMEYFPSLDYTEEDGCKNAVKDIYASLGGDVAYQKQEWKEIQKKYADIERKSDEYCSNVYFSFISLLTLRKNHKDDLLRRGFTEEQIKKFLFRSMPKDTKGVANLLITKGYDLEGVPGFYKDEKGVWMCKYAEGYLCPVFDGEKNLILGFQIRLDNPYDGLKYIWFASKDKIGGVTSGSPSTYLPGKYSKCIIITEGILKATCIYALLGQNVSVVGVPGIKSIKGLKPYLDIIENSSALIFEAYDMEKEGRSSDEKEQEKFDSIKDWADKLCKMVEEYKLNYHHLTWDTDANGVWKEKYKGLDDFLLEYDEKDKFLRYIVGKAQKNQAMYEFLNKSLKAG